MNRLVRRLVTTAALAGAIGVGLATASPTASASCVASKEEGVWWNQTADGASKIEIRMTECGDQVLNGVRTRTAFAVDVWVRQSDGNLFHRGRFPAEPREDGGEIWLVTRVPVGGYVEEMWMRATDPRPSQRLRVWTDNQSLDSKPSYVTDTTYLRTPPPAPKPPTVADAVAPPKCWSCLLGG